MRCEHFGVCGSCTLWEIPYEEQCQHKQKQIQALFAPLHVRPQSFYPSPHVHYRSRAEFRIWKEGSQLHYAMGHKDKKGVVLIAACPKVEEPIFRLMPPLLESLNHDLLLRERLFGVEFLHTSQGLLVTLLYHKPLDATWLEAARVLQCRLNICIIGRSRGVRLPVSHDYVTEIFTIEERDYTYRIIEGGFSQPNRWMNRQMIAWVMRHLEGCRDLLELYCGYGNFTIPLSTRFQKVLATEISKTSIASAHGNCELNGVTNIAFVRLSAQELTSAFQKKRAFNRLKSIDLESYHFSHVFVDPPRSGMDEESLAFIARFETIIYISCNPHTLKRDLEVLLHSHTVIHFALFDQFPHTEHLESGLILKRK